jgi:TolA-binding protein
MHRDIISRAVILVSVFVLWFAPYHAAGDILSTQQEIESLIEANKLTDAQTQIAQLKADYFQDPQLPEALYLIAERYRWQQKWEQANNLHNQIIQDYPDNPSASRANLGIARAGVLSLLVAEDYDGAQQALDELLADFTGHPDLPETLYWIAERYKWKQKHDKAISIHQQIVQNYPDSPFASKSRLGLVRTEILSLIENRQYEQADEAIETMLSDFAGHPDLPGTLYQIAECYRYSNKTDRTKELYQQIIQDYPNSSNAVRARLGQAKLEVLSLIDLRKFGPAEKALDKLISDFAGQPDLPETLYWIAEDFRWSEQYEAAKSTYQRIIEGYPASSYASKARLSFSQANICSLISLGQIEEAQAAIENLKTEFAGRPDLPDVLYTIALRLEWSNNYGQAKTAYEQVPKQSSGGSSEIDVQLDIARMNVCSLIAFQQFQAAQSALNGLIADFNDHPDIVETVLTIGEEYAAKAYQYEQDGDAEKAGDYYRRAIEVWEKIITDFAPCDLTAQAYYAAGYSYKILGEFEKAIQYCRKTLDQWPDFRSAWKAQCLIALCYEQLEASGEISRSDAAAQINEVCQKLAGYPYPQARAAARALFKKRALNEN